MNHHRLADDTSSWNICRPPLSTRRVMQVITPSHMSGAEMQLVRLTRQMQARGHQFSTVIKRGCPATAEMQRLGIDAKPLAIGGKLNPLAIHVLAQHAAADAGRRHSIDPLDRQLVVRLARTPQRHAHHRPRAGLHLRPLASAAVAPARRLASREGRPRRPRHRGRQNHRALQRARARRSSSPGAIRGTVRDEFGATADTPVIGTIAHLSEKKGHRDLFAAMPTVCREFPQVQFWIVGQGQLRDELEATARANGTINNVRFLGFRRDMADLMNAIDVMALPSHREPCALVYIEAALMKKPILACRAGGAPESVADGETGLLVPVRDSEAIAAALCELLDNRDQRRAMGQRRLRPRPRPLRLAALHPHARRRLRPRARRQHRHSGRPAASRRVAAPRFRAGCALRDTL